MYSTIILSAVFAAVFAAECEEGWKYFPSTHSCYKHIDDNLPWTVGEFKCLFQGAHHVSIRSAAENQFVHEVAKRGEIWTGAAFFGRTPRYVNSDQTPFGTFEEWKQGSRPPMNRARRCVKMDRNGKWFQSCCKKSTATVCKKAAPQKASYTWELENNVWRRKFVRV